MWYCCLCFVDIVDIDVDDDGYVVEKGGDDDDNDGVADANDFVNVDVKADTMMWYCDSVMMCQGIWIEKNVVDVNL